MNIANESGQKLSELVPEIDKTANHVAEITAASQEQSSGAEQVNNLIQQLNTIIQQNTAFSLAMVDNSKKVSGMANDLNNAIHYFKI